MGGGGLRGNREVPPALWRRGLAGETGFPPRERAEGERRSCRGEVAGAGPRSGRRELPLDARERERQRGQVGVPLEADVAAPPLREELAVEGQQALDLEQ